jgi:hypothetical protein
MKLAMISPEISLKENIFLLMYVRQLTNCNSLNERDVDGSSSSFVFTMNIIITNRITSEYSFWKKHDTPSVTQYLKYLNVLEEIFSFSRNKI